MIDLALEGIAFKQESVPSEGDPALLFGPTGKSPCRYTHRDTRSTPFGVEYL